MVVKKFIEKQIVFLVKADGNPTVCVTLGSKGAVWYEDSHFIYQSGFWTKVADTVEAVIAWDPIGRTFGDSHGLILKKPVQWEPCCLQNGSQSHNLSKRLINFKAELMAKIFNIITVNLLIAPDSFKGSLSAKEVARAMEQAAQSVYLLKTHCIPFSDGGEGSLDFRISFYRGFQWVETQMLWAIL